MASHWGEIAAAHDHVRRAQSGATLAFEVFSSDQAADVEALAAQIIPSDDTPGAREARVVYFIDRALATFAADQRRTFLKGLKQLAPRTKRASPKTKRFSALSPDEQAALVKKIEKTSFFELARTLTIIGMFASPEYGGNHDQIGWSLIGFEDRFFFKPPFGFYDREYHSAD
jgi:gluconate 2-dehydrogenase gamma chain